MEQWQACKIVQQKSEKATRVPDVPNPRGERAGGRQLPVTEHRTAVEAGRTWLRWVGWRYMGVPSEGTQRGWVWVFQLVNYTELRDRFPKRHLDPTCIYNQPDRHWFLFRHTAAFKSKCRLANQDEYLIYLVHYFPFGLILIFWLDGKAAAFRDCLDTCLCVQDVLTPNKPRTQRTNRETTCSVQCEKQWSRSILALKCCCWTSDMKVSEVWASLPTLNLLENCISIIFINKNGFRM